MTLVLELPPDTAARLREHAARQGRAEEEIALAALERLLEAEAPQQRRSILEFRGVGKHNPVGQDPQAYVDEMRDEWNRRS